MNSKSDLDERQGVVTAPLRDAYGYNFRVQVPMYSNAGPGSLSFSLRGHNLDREGSGVEIFTAVAWCKRSQHSSQGAGHIQSFCF